MIELPPGLVERTLAYLLENYARLEELIAGQWHRTSPGDRELCHAVLAKAQAQIRSLKLLLATYASAKELVSNRTIEAKFEVFRETHRRLHHVSIPPVPGEGLLFINYAWELATETRDSAPPKPILALSIDLDPSEHLMPDGPVSLPGGADEQEVPTGDISVLSLAKVDFANPLAWTVVGHEIAHNLLPGEELAVGVPDALKSWLTEMLCDQFALRLCGPAYLLDVGLRSVINGSYSTHSISHPSPEYRIFQLLENAPEWMKDTEPYRVATEMHRERARDSTENGRASDPFQVTPFCNSCLRPTDMKEVPAQELPQGLQAGIEVIDRLLKGRQYTADHFSTALGLTNGFNIGHLVGGPRDIAKLRKSLDCLEDALADTLPENEKARNVEEHYSAAVAAITNRPAGLFDILNAGWVSYLSRSQRRLAEIVDASEKTDREFEMAWRRYCQDVVETDQLALASIETAQFHRLMKDSE